MRIAVEYHQAVLVYYYHRMEESPLHIETSKIALACTVALCKTQAFKPTKSAKPI
jgi:hypothetical protein